MPPSKRSKHRRMGSNTSTEEKSDFEARMKIPAELVKGPWKKQEDELLASLVEEHGPKDWSKIANKMAQLGHVRMGKQCRERWFNHLSPEVRKEAWTSEEDRVIIESHRQLGNKWTAISRLLNGRPANAIKNHWNSTLKRQVQFGAEIGSGSPRPGKRQRATVGHQSRKKRRLDDSRVSSYESDEDFDSTSDEMDEDDSELVTYENRNEDQDQVREDQRTFETSPAEAVVQSASSEDETLAHGSVAAHDPLAMDTTNPVWNIDLMNHNEYDSMQVTQNFQYQQPQTYNNYNGFNTAVYPVMNEFHDVHQDQRQAVSFNTYWDPFEFGAPTYTA
eukprot:TRINITY_DN1163_c0_g1_i1.p1 TRINITY_DN1163_c0_g1~~TRINITY_DN1163_c0_g1_i1.p1  ORF type:complete len:333 (+),score=68.75 TRINITY_DN1163_c0_g1_i1:146-1144(+)